MLICDESHIHWKHFFNSVLTGPTYKLINIKTLRRTVHRLVSVLVFATKRMSMEGHNLHMTSVCNRWACATILVRLRFFSLTNIVNNTHTVVISTSAATTIKHVKRNGTSV